MDGIKSAEHRAESKMMTARKEVDCPQGVKGHTSLAVPLCPRYFCTAQATAVASNSVALAFLSPFVLFFVVSLNESCNRRSFSSSWADFSGFPGDVGSAYVP